ncbi:alpha-1,2-fucosyltransferase [Olleya sp. YS]|uniref:alpha-1,2-fucosyltransferase n=1 Tax=Olleya sp. YS TaxID=3028318 RepID=UPI00243427EB|nr:alpha-1,2-fucosyltransferase [Olleya sp. YS]WGD34884.1 alpha-1,2-fucosyltransferase [Olleya sp. YS]
MIVIKLIGGLGNQMFQYAAAKAVALHTKQELKLDTSGFDDYNLHDYGLHHFNINAKLFNQKSKWIRKLEHKLNLTTYYNEQSFRFNPEVFNINTKNIQLNGYFQSEDYFINYRNDILNNFKIVSPLKQQTQYLLAEMAKTNAVSIHIRRGDFLKHEVHNTSKAQYYKDAMAVIESKIEQPTYYLFSDDMEWVKANFKTNHKAVYVDCNDAATAFEDIKLMSNCKHNIIANSSFSWWSAWLNTNPNKIVIAPKQWFNGDQYDYTDVVPKSWIKL